MNVLFWKFTPVFGKILRSYEFSNFLEIILMKYSLKTSAHDNCPKIMLIAIFLPSSAAMWKHPPELSKNGEFSCVTCVLSCLKCHQNLTPLVLCDLLGWCTWCWWRCGHHLERWRRRISADCFRFTRCHPRYCHECSGGKFLCTMWYYLFANKKKLLWYRF